MKQLSIFYKRVYEASIPCAILMVQGNVLGLTPRVKYASRFKS